MSFLCCIVTRWLHCVTASEWAKPKHAVAESSSVAGMMESCCFVCLWLTCSTRCRVTRWIINRNKSRWSGGWILFLSEASLLLAEASSRFPSKVMDFFFFFFFLDFELLWIQPAVVTHVWSVVRLHVAAKWNFKKWAGGCSWVNLQSGLNLSVIWQLQHLSLSWSD